MQLSNRPSQCLPKETPLGPTIQLRVQLSNRPSQCLPKETPLGPTIQLLLCCERT